MKKVEIQEKVWGYEVTDICREWNYGYFKIWKLKK